MTPRIFFKDFVEQGADNVNQSLPMSDPGYLSSADVMNLKSTVDDATWECSWTLAHKAHTCKYFIPVKRFNVYPDAVELVWFDGKETKNPAYALWVASYMGNPEMAKARTQMCQWNPTHQHDELYTRRFAWTRR